MQIGQQQFLSDTSSYGLAAVLLQKQDNDQWRPVAYTSRAMSPTEQRYAQIEKETLGITWASERFADYLIGLKFHTSKQITSPLCHCSVPRVLRISPPEYSD